MVDMDTDHLKVALVPIFSQYQEVICGQIMSSLDDVDQFLLQIRGALILNA